MRRHSIDQAPEQVRVDRYFHEVAQYWTDIYEGEGVTELIHQDRLRLMLKLIDGIHLPSRARVLDVGSGSGVGAVAMARKGYLVEAIDTVPDMVDSTSQLAIRAAVKSNLTSSQGDVHCIPFPDEAFHLVVAMGVLPWLTSIKKPLQEMCRVLRPTGYILVSVDNRWALHRFLDPLANPLFKPVNETYRWLQRRYGKAIPRLYVTLRSIRECEAQLRAASLEKLQTAPLGFGPFSICYREVLSNAVGLKLHQTLQGLANRDFPVLRAAGSQFVMLARKPLR